MTAGKSHICASKLLFSHLGLC